MRRISAIVLVSVLAACGGGKGTSVTGSSTAGSEPRTVEAVSGATDAVVALTPPVTATPCQVVNLAAPNFLSLRTAYSGHSVPLWPNDESLPLYFTLALIYRNVEPGNLVRLRDNATIS